MIWNLNKQMLFTVLLLKASLPKNLFTYSQSIQDVNEFVSSSEQIWINLALRHLLSNGSSAVNGCHQNTADKSITGESNYR